MNKVSSLDIQIIWYINLYNKVQECLQNYK